MAKKITIVLNSYKGGGAEESLMALANGLAARRQVTISLLVLNRNGPLKETPSDHVNIIAGRSMAWPAAHSLGFALWQIVWHGWRDRPAVWICGGFASNQLLLGLRRLRAIPGRTIAIEQLSLSQRLDTHRSLSPLLRRIFRFAYKHADCVASSELILDDLRQLLGLKATPDTWEVLPGLPRLHQNPQRMATQRPDSEFARIHSQLSRPRIFSVGRLEKQKDFAFLLRAFAIFLKLRPSASLTIVGTGSRYQELEQLAVDLGVGDSVLFAGYQMNPWWFAKNSDVIAFTSSFEGGPNFLSLTYSLELAQPIVLRGFASYLDAVYRNIPSVVITPFDSETRFAEGLMSAITHETEMSILPTSERPDVIGWFYELLMNSP